MLKLGDKVPSTKFPSTEGKKISLRDYKGKKLILFFYPKDNTPGCTKEACRFRDLKSEFEILGAQILGVSKDSLTSHDKFIKKHGLNFPLIADEDLKLMEEFGVWKEKKMYGKTFMGVVRSTFLIDEKGNLKKAWRNVKVKGHVDDVLTYLAK